VADNRPDPRSGLDEQGGWSPVFEGQRPPFTPGNELSVRHGAFSMVKLEPRVHELVGEIRELVPAWRPPDDVTIHLLAIALARIEALYAKLTAGDVDLAESADKWLRSWVNSARQSADKLALNPTARGRLGLDVAQTARVLTLADLHAEAELERREEPS
jgi:hypothetical protein